MAEEVDGASLWAIPNCVAAGRTGKWERFWENAMEIGDFREVHARDGQNWISPKLERPRGKGNQGTLRMDYTADSTQN